MNSIIKVQDPGKPLPKNTLKHHPARTPQETIENVTPTNELLLQALKKIFRWKTIIILWNFTARKMGMTSPRKNYLEKFQEHLYHKLESFFGY